MRTKKSINVLESFCFESDVQGLFSEVSEVEMIDVIGQVVGVNPTIEQLPMQPGDVDQTFADISKAKELLGYDPDWSFERGIAAAIEWYKENL